MNFEPDAAIEPSIDWIFSSGPLVLALFLLYLINYFKI